MFGFSFHWIFAHLVGDYLLQNDWMASHKKDRIPTACVVHVLFYCIPFLFTPLSGFQLFLIAAQHYIQDRSNFPKWFLEVTGSPSFARKPFAPWSIIICDNIFHILWIELVYKIVAY